MYILRLKYYRYLHIKRLISFGLVAHFTNCELTKMSYARTIGSNSFSLTVPGLVSYSLLTFFFFNMISYYVPTKSKLVCQVCKYVAGAPFWILCKITNKLTKGIEEDFLGQLGSMDVTNNGGIIPAEVDNLQSLRIILEEAKQGTAKQAKKLYAKSY